MENLPEEVHLTYSESYEVWYDHTTKGISLTQW